MTKDAYFEMCEALGSEPNEDEIPVEHSDLHMEVQEAFSIYNKLRDDWDYMGGTYIGKNIDNLLGIFILLEIPKEDRLQVYELINLIDSYRSKAIAASKKASEASKNKK